MRRNPKNHTLFSKEELEAKLFRRRIKRLTIINVIDLIILRVFVPIATLGVIVLVVITIADAKYEADREAAIRETILRGINTRSYSDPVSPPEDVSPEDIPPPADYPFPADPTPEPEDNIDPTLFESPLGWLYFGLTHFSDDDLTTGPLTWLYNGLRLHPSD